MHPKGVVWTLGVLVSLFGASMAAPVLVSVHYHTGHAIHFTVSAVLVLASGLGMMQMGEMPKHLSHRDGFLIVALAWVVLSVLGAVPFWATGTCQSFIDGLFESASGLTTTGATVLSGLDAMPPSILFWRSMEQWFGGMGIIVLAVAILPFLGVGGMQMYRAEVPGPVKDKLTSRITETGKLLWYIYLGMTIVTALCFWLAGMGGFDAINHAMCTLSTGGFSTHDASIGYYQSESIHWLTVLFMFLAGVNFTLHFAVIRRGFRINTYFSDSEFRAYVWWIVLLILVVGMFVLISGSGQISDVVFSIISIVTTSGFVVTDYSQWPSATMLLFFAAMFIGGCAGSTAGGIKVVRVLLLFRQGVREVRQLIHPHAIIHVKIGGKRVTDTVVQALWGFFALYMVCYGIIAFLLAMSGVSPLDALSATAACISNVGPGFGSVGPVSNYENLNAAAKGLLIFGMILGRLEIFTLLALLMPEFWRK